MLGYRHVYMHMFFPKRLAANILLYTLPHDERLDLCRQQIKLYSQYFQPYHMGDFDFPGACEQWRKWAASFEKENIDSFVESLSWYMTDRQSAVHLGGKSFINFKVWVRLARLLYHKIRPFKPFSKLISQVEIKRKMDKISRVRKIMNFLLESKA